MDSCPAWISDTALERFLSLPGGSLRVVCVQRARPRRLSSSWTTGARHYSTPFPAPVPWDRRGDNHTSTFQAMPHPEGHTIVLAGRPQKHHMNLTSAPESFAASLWIFGWSRCERVISEPTYSWVMIGISRSRHLTVRAAVLSRPAIWTTAAIRRRRSLQFPVRIGVAAPAFRCHRTPPTAWPGKSS